MPDHSRTDVSKHGALRLVRKAIIPAGGFGTRFLPVAKAVPKELLPVLGRPVIDYVVSEAIEAGCTDICIILRAGKESIQKLFEPDPALEAKLASAGRFEDLELVRNTGSGARICYVYQPEPLGLGDAVLRGRHFAGDDPFLVLAGDTIIEPGVARYLVAAYNGVDRSAGRGDAITADSTRYAAAAEYGESEQNAAGAITSASRRNPATAEHAEPTHYAARSPAAGAGAAGPAASSSRTAPLPSGTSAVAVEHVPDTLVSRYGIVSPAEEPSALNERTPFPIDRLVEKPDPVEAPSNYAISARYLFTSAIWSFLEKTKPGRGGEIQLTDAMDQLARFTGPGGGMVAVPIPGKRYDLGNPIDFLAAEVEFARKQLSAEDLRRTGL